MRAHGWVYIEKAGGDVIAIGQYPTIDAADRVVDEVDWDDSVEHLYLEDCIELWSSAAPPSATRGVVTAVEPFLYPWPERTPVLSEFLP